MVHGVSVRHKKLPNYDFTHAHIAYFSPSVLTLNNIQQAIKVP